jgi:type II secretory pathway predicted ATPase ExeA
MAYLRYGLEQAEGFIVITGGIGTGKTMLVRTLFNELDGRNIMAAQLVTTQVEPDDVLRMVCASLGLAHEGMNKATLLHNLEVIARNCFRDGKHILLVVDEAQNLPVRSIEELRMLANFQVEGRSLFQSFLLGQDQLRTTLLDPTMEQLRQRIIASYHLEPLTEEETERYVEHRLSRVGWKGDPNLDDGLLARIFAFTEGVPRRVNTLCDRLLLYGCIEEKHALGPNDVKVVEAELTREMGQPQKLSHEGTDSSSAVIDAGMSDDGEEIQSEGNLPVSQGLVMLEKRVGGLRRIGQFEDETVNGKSMLYALERLETEFRSLTRVVERVQRESMNGKHMFQRLARLEAEVKGLKQVVQRERKLLRKALLLQLDLEADDDID